MALLDIVIIVGISLLSAALSEAASWYLIYRTPAYQKLKTEIEYWQGRMEAEDQDFKSEKKKKKTERHQSSLKSKVDGLHTKLTGMTMWSNILLTGTLIGVYSVLSSWYDGVVVAQLPFEPWGFIQGISHRGLAGENYHECGFAFIYVLCSLGVRASFTKVFGHKAPKNPKGSFMQQLMNPDPSTMSRIAA